jgi:hypothetical protein
MNSVNLESLELQTNSQLDAALRERAAQIDQFEDSLRRNPWERPAPLQQYLSYVSKMREWLI